MNQKRMPTHPGIVFLEDVMKPLGLTTAENAEKLKENCYFRAVEKRLFCYNLEY